MFFRASVPQIIAQNLRSTLYRLLSNVKITPVRLAYDYLNGDSNVNPPLIIVHCLFGSKLNWSKVAKAINEGTKRDVICVDCRNHGESPHTPEHTNEHMTEDIQMLMKELRVSKSSILGHSMGGRAVMHFAFSYPNLVEKLIVADISPVSAIPDMEEMYKIFNAMEAVNFLQGARLSTCRKNADEHLAKSIDDKHLRAFLVTNVVQTNGSCSWRINIPVLRANFQEIARSPEYSTTFNKPTLFLGSEKSGYVPFEDHVGILSLFPKAKIKYIAEAGHMLHIDNPEKFISYCVDFLSN